MSDKQQRRDWGSAFSVYANPRVMGMMFLGFSAGLPYMLIFGIMSAWLKDIGIPTFIIGFFAWISITYSIKIFWAPIIDVLNVPLLTRWLGHRRSWMLVSQIGIALGLLGLSVVDPHSHLWLLAWFGLLTAFCSATQDICVDAYRIEAVPNEYQAAMASTYMFGYRLAIIISGAGVLLISVFANWSTAYYLMALLMSVGMITTLIIQEPINRASKKSMPVELVQQHMESFKTYEQTILKRILKLFSVVFMLVLSAILLIFPVFIPIIMWVMFKYRDHNIKNYIADWYKGTVVGPIVDFVFRYGFKMAMMILALIMLYRISDLFMGFMANPLYLDKGFGKVEIAMYTKVFGIVMTLTGTIMGGVMVMRYGVMKILLLGSIMVASTNLLFSALAIWPSVPMLITVIIGDNISTGVATAAFIAYLSALVNKQYTATQFALFTSLMLLLGKFTQGFSGAIVDGIGYPIFFVIAAITGVPTILLIGYLMKIGHDPRPHEIGEEDEVEGESEQEEPKRSKLKLILVYSVIPIVIGGMVVMIMFERGIYQFNNPDQNIYTVRGVSISPNKKICWGHLDSYRWDEAGKQKLNFMYFNVTKGIEKVKTAEELKLAADKKRKKEEARMKMTAVQRERADKKAAEDKRKAEEKKKICVQEDGQKIKYSRGLKVNWANALKYELKVGAIHTFSRCAKGLPQALHMIKKVPIMPGALPPVIKIVNKGGCPVQEQLSTSEVIAELKIMAQRLQKHYGKKPVLMGNDKIYTLMIKDHFQDFKFWVDSGYKTPSPQEVKKWLLWEYSSRFPVEGISGYAKMSVIKGKF